MIGYGLLFPAAVGAAALSVRAALPIESCPGYKASNIQDHGGSLTADLQLAGSDTYGSELTTLKLKVDYETKEPFSFAVTRADTKKTLFNTSGSNLIFRSQYLNLRTSLPQNPNLYDLGEHSDTFRLNTTNYTRTLWNRDAFTIPAGTSLYGSHPVYVDHHKKFGAYGAFLLNSNGMDIKVNQTENGEQYLEYNILGGVSDFYFLARPSPKEVAARYARVVGLPAMIPYWGYGFQQCRYGYRGVFELAEVVYNYSQAKIPLETMWTDIDYMDVRRVFTLDPLRFPLDKMRDLVSYLHEHCQHYVVMVAPAVSYSNNSAFQRGVEQDVFLKENNGSIFKGTSSFYTLRRTDLSPD
ncbi:hypothetical protein EYZ11_004825 [Aspergillus tanneri]|uniref:Alpha-glucosidase n=1 Tax=Aspergillus tanneri TaxID=1220188 RepID=A0A4S3JJR4_9EURO|nr:hypothetical protein EYZ11_004825 [Aspergillus tanneri]